MTKEKIIKMICATWIKDENGIPFILDYNAIANELLVKIKQEKEEQAREIFTKIYNELEYDSLGQFAIIKLAEEYGVEL